MGAGQNPHSLVTVPSSSGMNFDPYRMVPPSDVNVGGKKNDEN